MRHVGKISRIALVALYCLPLLFLADAGTPLMWAGMFHLIVGNGLIGIGEGLFLAYLFKLRRGKCVGTMIAANYFSAWVGYVFLLGYFIKAPSDLNLYTAWGWVWQMVVATFFITCILEWPFVFRCLRGVGGRVRKSIWGNFLVQFVSYLLIFGWYWSASGRSLYTQMHIVKPVAFSIPTNTAIYFISTNGNVCSFNVSGGEIRTVADLNSTNDEDRLYLKKTESGRTSIYARLEIPQNDRCIVSNLEVTATVPKYDEEPNQHRNNWSPQWFVAPIGSASNSAWSFQTGYWAVEGLVGENSRTRERLHLALETPFAQWIVRNAYQLPGDCVIFQLGSNQICILDPNTKRVALLIRGYGPVVVLEGD
jgi:hypothetical protein